MKTTMNIPRELLEEAMEACDASSKTMTVILGLQELIRNRRLKELRDLLGSGALRISREELRESRRR